MTLTKAQQEQARSPSDSDAGSVALFLALITVALLALAGLVVDGGAALAARGHAHDLADQAARAGAEALSPASLRAANPADLAIDPAAARAAAQTYLATAQATGTVSIAGQVVTVTAHVPRHATILSAFGIHDISGSATASATIVHGVVTGGP